MTNEQLAKFIKEGDSEDLKPVLWERVKKLLYAKAAAEYNRRKNYCDKCGIELWDIKQACYEVYLKALEGYKPDKPALFNTYLSYPLLNVINDMLGTRNGRENNKPLDNCSSLDKTIEVSDDNLTLGDTIADEYAELAFEDVEINCDRRIVREEVAGLEEPYRSVIIRYFFESMTLGQIGELMNVSRERVRQIEAKALRKLRKNDRLLLLYRENRENTHIKQLSSRYWASPEYFEVISYIKRAEQRGEFISYGKRQAMIYQQHINYEAEQSKEYKVWEALEQDCINM